jgi:Fe-S cluster biosynthesis and repair protein YggX
MANISTLVRPQVVFNSDNPDHRKWVANFIKTKSWRDCPVRFLVNDNSLDMANVVQRQLLEYYINKEFV